MLAEWQELQSRPLFTRPWGALLAQQSSSPNRSRLVPEVTIYHNPSCGTSRNTLALIRHAGIEPEVVEYLKTPPSKAELREWVAAMGTTVRMLLREKGTPYAALSLADPRWTDDQLLDFIGQYPILLNRPIVVTPLGIKLCRPCEEVLELLPVGQVSLFTKEGGEVVADTGARRGERKAT